MTGGVKGRSATGLAAGCSRLRRALDSHLRLLAHAGAIDIAAVADTIRLLDEVRAMTWRLLHPKE